MAMRRIPNPEKWDRYLQGVQYIISFLLYKDNTMSKTWSGRKEAKVDNPHEIWIAGDWEWRVLKKWQENDDAQYARWMCAVKSPMTYGRYEYGDVYVSEIKSVAMKVQ